MILAGMLILSALFLIKNTSATKIDIDDRNSASFASVKIVAEWIIDEGAEKPEKIEMQLWRDGELYEDFALTNDNGYEKVWLALDKGHDYEFKQVSGIDGYFLGEIEGSTRYGYRLVMKQALKNEIKIPEWGAYAGVISISTIAGVALLRGLFTRR